MTPTVSSPRRRGASLALGGMIMVAGTMFAGAPVAFAEPSTEAINAINEKATSYAVDYPWLGAPTGEAVDVKGGAMRAYEGGGVFPAAIYWSKDTGAHVVHGEILKRYQALGGPDTSELGFPKNDESDTGDGVGRFNEFSAPEGAAIYWNPQLGASVIRGKVLEAWNQSGGIKGPFGYPTADMTVVDGVQTGKFAGPEGTEIQWSKAAGLVTIPAALAGKIPGFGTGGTTSVSKSVAAKGETEKKGGFKWWWWLLLGLLLLGLLWLLSRLFRKKTEVVEPVKVVQRTTEVKRVVTPPPPPRPAPVAKPVTPPAPPRPAPVKPVIPPPPPVVKTPPPAPKPVVPPPAPRLVEKVREEIREVKAEIHEHHIEHEAKPVIHYETEVPADTGIQVTYENNAIGAHEESRADKSDTVPDYLQE